MAAKKDDRQSFEALLRVKPGSKVDVARFDCAATFGRDKDVATDELPQVLARLTDLQARTWAEAKHAVLVVIQGIDAAGKDGTIKVIAGRSTRRERRSRRSRRRARSSLPTTTCGASTSASPPGARSASSTGAITRTF